MPETIFEVIQLAESIISQSQYVRYITSIKWRIFTFDCTIFTMLTADTPVIAIASDINKMLTDEQILKSGSVFTNNELTNLLFNMADVDLDIGKLAVWRIATHDNFGGNGSMTIVLIRLE